MTQNSNNQKFTNNADGFDLAGGTTARKITLSGADVDIVGSGTAVITFPSDTSTLATLALAETLTNKDLSAASNTLGSANVAAAGALMDSEVTNLADVKAFDTTDYATAAQGATADSAVQDTGDETIAGIKTFTSSPIVPAPTTNLQAATKKYVDDNAGGSASNVNVETFTADGTWTKPAGLLYIEVESWGGGGGGNIDGGGGGAYNSMKIPASDLAASEIVTVGAGGTGGDGSGSSAGTDGEDSSFGSFITAGGGVKGASSGKGGESYNIGDYAGGTAGGGDSVYGGGGGGSYSGGAGGDSVYGGGGGGAGLGGGDGGDGGDGSGGQAGSVPGGGGGAIDGYYNGHDGARGEVQVFEYFE